LSGSSNKFRPLAGFLFAQPTLSDAVFSCLPLAKSSAQSANIQTQTNDTLRASVRDTNRQRAFR
jgi:hypothetical protein